jgi:hypothetical protein
MAVEPERRRVLVAAREAERSRLRRLFGSPELPGWEVVEAETCERARFLNQLDPCDAVVVDAGLAGGVEALAWLTGGDATPVLYLADATPEAAREALRRGAHCWLPRRPALEQPGLLAAALDRLAELGELRKRKESAETALRECRRQVDRLVDLLWEVVPGAGPGQWLSQRHVLLRCEEEVARSRRHAIPLSVVLGEVHGPNGPPGPAEARDLASWAARRISQAKRRCDVAGQYGLHGFLLLLPHTTAAGAASCCQRLEGALQPPPGAARPRAPLRLYTGIVDYSPETPSLKTMLSHAEEALDRARSGSGPLAPSAALRPPL